MSTIHEKIGDDLQGFGGHLECTVCGRKQRLGNVGMKLRDGWPMCCGYTMRWFTRNELARLNGGNESGDAEGTMQAQPAVSDGD